MGCFDFSSTFYKPKMSWKPSTEQMLVEKKPWACVDQLKDSFSATQVPYNWVWKYLMWRLTCMCMGAYVKEGCNSVASEQCQYWTLDFDFTRFQIIFMSYRNVFDILAFIIPAYGNYGFVKFWEKLWLLQRGMVMVWVTYLNQTRITIFGTFRADNNKWHSTDILYYHLFT